MSKVAIVTDSTVTIPAHLLEGHNIRVIPQVVIWGEKTYRDGIDIKPKEFYERLAASSVSPTTSQASAGDFKTLYEELHSQGYDILTIVLSSKLSGTYASAIQAREMVPGSKIEIVDSYSIAMAMGFLVLETAKKAEAGADLASCTAFAEKGKKHLGLVVAPETLEYLHRGGRIGGGARFLGTALNIRPILDLKEGRLEPVERVRTRKKVLKRMAELVAERTAGQSPVRVSALHANSPEDAQTLFDYAKEMMQPVELVLSEVSPAIGTHTGPGTVGLVYMAGL